MTTEGRWAWQIWKNLTSTGHNLEEMQQPLLRLRLYTLRCGRHQQQKESSRDRNLGRL